MRISQHSPPFIETFNSLIFESFSKKVCSLITMRSRVSFSIYKTRIIYYVLPDMYYFDYTCNDRHLVNLGPHIREAVTLPSNCRTDNRTSTSTVQWKKFLSM